MTSPLATAPLARTRPPDPDDGLAPVRAALRAAARADADRLLADADVAVAAARGEGERRAVSVIDQARAEGDATAARMLAADRARARRDARQIVLGARRAAWEELRRICLGAAEHLAAEPDYPALAERLAARARARLGEEAAVEVDGPEGAGVVAREGNRRIDLRLEVLAERALASVGPRLERLWR